MKIKNKKKTEREIMSSNNKLLTNLLIHEASGGIIPLPEGVEKYTPPMIPFTERRALVDMVNKVLMVDMKINPESEETGFEMLKGELDERKRSSGASKIARSRRILAAVEDDDESGNTHDGEIDEFYRNGASPGNA